MRIVNWTAGKNQWNLIKSKMLHTRVYKQNYYVVSTAIYSLRYVLVDVNWPMTNTNITKINGRKHDSCISPLQIRFWLQLSYVIVDTIYFPWTFDDVNLIEEKCWELSSPLSLFKLVQSKAGVEFTKWLKTKLLPNEVENVTTPKINQYSHFTNIACRLNDTIIENVWGTAIGFAFAACW